MSTNPNLMPILTRDQARAIGSRFYFTNKTCIHGHRAKRYTANGHCVVCNDLHNAARPPEPRASRSPSRRRSRQEIRDANH